MWKRIIKNRFGEPDRIIKEDPYRYLNGRTYQKGDPYDKLPDVIFTVEYLRKDLADVERNHIDPWELWDVYETDSLGQAIGEVIHQMFRDDTVDYKLFMDVGDKDCCAEVPSDVYRFVRECVQNGINKQFDSMKETITAQKNELDDMMEFLRCYHAEDMYKEWKQKTKQKKGD